jgi:hypothetical protein
MVLLPLEAICFRFFPPFYLTSTQDIEILIKYTYVEAVHFCEYISLKYVLIHFIYYLNGKILSCAVSYILPLHEDEFCIDRDFFLPFLFPMVFPFSCLSTNFFFEMNKPICV